MTFFLSDFSVLTSTPIFPLTLIDVFNVCVPWSRVPVRKPGGPSVRQPPPVSDTVRLNKGQDIFVQCKSADRLSVNHCQFSTPSA